MVASSAASVASSHQSQSIAGWKSAVQLASNHTLTLSTGWVMKIFVVPSIEPEMFLTHSMQTLIPRQLTRRNQPAVRLRTRTKNLPSYLVCNHFSHHPLHHIHPPVYQFSLQWSHDCRWSFLSASKIWASEPRMGCCSISPATLVMTNSWDPPCLEQRT